jgi:hypothetical protein
VSPRRGAQDVGLFEADAPAPLAARMRPRTLDEFVGQEHLIGEGHALRRAIETDRIPSMILWGPPGTGKTTLSEVIAQKTGAQFVALSAVRSLPRPSGPARSGGAPSSLSTRSIASTRRNKTPCFPMSKTARLR